MLLVATSEELLYRGLWPELHRLFPTSTGWVALEPSWLILGVCGFSLMHAYAGLGEVVSKFGLGLLCAGLLWVSEGLAAPVSAHVAYNFASVVKGR